MRLFLNGWTDKENGFYDVAVRLKESGHEIIYWSAFNILKDIDVSEFSGTIFHDSFDALQAKPAAGVDISHFLPIDSAFARDLYETEIAVLTMMNKKYENYSVDERKRLYYSMVSYWTGVLKKYRSDAIIFQMLPHTVFDFIIFNLAKRFGIKTLFFKLTTLDDRLFLLSDYEIYPPIFWNWQNSSENFKLEDISEDIRKIYLKHKNIRSSSREIGSYVVQYVQNMRNDYSSWHLIWKKITSFFNILCHPFLFKKIPQLIKNKFSSNLKKEYLAVQSQVDWNKKFIYTTLAYQPECSTSPQGGIFVDQILMLETLSVVLPDDWVIYVKEHPVQWMIRGLNYFSYRYRGYYRKIAALRNVKIVPIETDSLELIKKCVAVANVTGSSGFEAVVRSKPALLFGHEWYQSCPGVFMVRGSGDCRLAIEKIKHGAVPVEQDLINYLVLISRHTLRGYIDPLQMPYSSLSIEENAENLSQALLRELK